MRRLLILSIGCGFAAGFALVIAAALLKGADQIAQLLAVHP